MARFSSNKLIVSGTYTNSIKVDYEVRVVVAPQESTFGVKIVNYDRELPLVFTYNDNRVRVLQPDGDGTFSNHEFGVPIWVGDYLYEVSGEDSITTNSSGFIGRVKTITSGTEGYSVKTFTIDDGSGTDGISNSSTWTGDREVLVSYQAQVHDSGTNCIDHDADTEKFGSDKTYMHGLEFRWSGSMTGASATEGSYHAFSFSGYPSKDFIADSIVKVQKNEKHHIVGWDKSFEKFTKVEDVYTENANANNISQQEYLNYGLPITSKPTFNPRGDDIFVGLGPNQDNVYMGYPNIKQFGIDIGDDFVIENGVLDVDLTVLPRFKEFVLPNNSNTGASAYGLDVDLTSSTQLVVGYVEGSSYLMKGTRSKGITSTYNVGGPIKALYLDHNTSNIIWVLFDGGDQYRVGAYSIGNDSTSIDIYDNRVYRMQDSGTDEKWLTPFEKENAVMTDLIITDDGSANKHIYVLASAPNYYSQDDRKSKCFGYSANREAYIWRSDNIYSSPSAFESGINYHNLDMNDITPSFYSNPDKTNAQRDPYFIDFTIDDWDSQSESQSYQGSGGGVDVLNVSETGGSAEQYKFLRSPVPKGLILWSDKTDGESIAVAIGITYNSMEGNNWYRVYETNQWSGSSGGDSEEHTEQKCVVGPLVYQDSKAVILGTHFEIYNDSINSKSSSDSDYNGVKRIVFDNSNQGTTDGITRSIGTGSGSENFVIYGKGSNLGRMIKDVTTYANDNSRLQPLGIAIGSTNNIRFFDLDTLSSAKLNANDIDGLYFLNNSVDNKKFVPSDNEGWFLPSQQLNYLTSPSLEFDWLACSNSLEGAIYYIANPSSATEDDTWSKVGLKSAIDVSIASLSSGEEDINNLKPDASGGNDDDYYKNFYRISLMYDGYQESVLADTIYLPTGLNPSKFGHEITIEVNPGQLSKRLSHVNIYRGRAYNNNAVDTDFDYNLVESIALQNKGWKTGDTTGYLKYVLKDNKGVNFGGYEALTGISPEMRINHLNYGISEQCSGYLFVSDANNPEVSNVSNYIFRSKPGKYSVFNWANEYVVLQDKPTALQSYNNLLYAFTPSSVYTIDPNSLSIVDKMEGMGCLDSDSIISTDFGMFFADKHGVYVHNGRNAQVISHPIHTSDNTDIVNFTWDSISTSLETAPPKLAFDGERKALLIIFDVSNVSYAWVYSVNSKRWDFWSFTNPITAVTQGKYGEVIASDGKLLQIATGSTRKNWEFHTKKITGGFDTYDKSFTEIHTEGTGSLETKYKTSGVSSLQSLSSNRISSSHRKAKWLQIRVLDSAGTGSLDSLGIHLRPIKARSTKV